MASGATASGAVCFRASETTPVTYAAGPPGSPIPARAPAARRRGQAVRGLRALDPPGGAGRARRNAAQAAAASAERRERDAVSAGWRSGIDREHRWRRTRQPERAVESRSRREGQLRVACFREPSGPGSWGRGYGAEGAAGGSPHGHFRRTVARRCCRRNAAVPPRSGHAEGFAGADSRRLVLAPASLAQGPWISSPLWNRTKGKKHVKVCALDLVGSRATDVGTS